MFFFLSKQIGFQRKIIYLGVILLTISLLAFEMERGYPKDSHLVKSIAFGSAILGLSLISAPFILKNALNTYPKLGYWITALSVAPFWIAMAWILMSLLKLEEFLSVSFDSAHHILLLSQPAILAVAYVIKRNVASP